MRNLSLSHKPRACCGSCPKAVKELLGSCSPGSVMQRRTCLHSSAAQPDLGRRGKAVPLLGTKEEGRRVTQESWWPSCHLWDQPSHGMGGATPRYSPTSENEAMYLLPRCTFCFNCLIQGKKHVLSDFFFFTRLIISWSAGLKL